jgi:hypothetical protein
MTVHNIIGLTLSNSELKIRSDIIAQLFFRKQVLPPDVLTMVTMRKYVAQHIRNKNCTHFAKNLLNRL